MKASIGVDGLPLKDKLNFLMVDASGEGLLAMVTLKGYKLSAMALKRPYMRKCNTQLRCPSPILMKFGPEVGFGPKPAPDKKILDFDPKNGVILGSEG